MRTLSTQLESVWLIEPERIEDERGFFARTWCQREFLEFGLDSELVQCSVSFNRTAGTLRGMHFQIPPHEETKLVRCTRGSIFDVVVDLREGSATLGKYQSFELSSDNHLAVYIPKGFAHGFQTLEPDTEVYYQMGQYFHPGSASGFHFADKELSIPWPLPVSTISTKDEELSSLSDMINTLAIRREGQYLDPRDGGQDFDDGTPL